jgi:hypothetical protein
MYQHHAEEKTLTQALKVECFVPYTIWKLEYMVVIGNKMLTGISVPTKDK